MTPTELLPALAWVAAALAEPLTDPASRTFAPWLGLAGLIGAAVAYSRGEIPGLLHRSIARWTGPSSRLDVQMMVLGRLLGALGWLPRAGLGLGLAAAVAGALGRGLGEPGAPSGPWVPLAFTLALFLARDLSRFLVHLAMHRSATLWAFHEVHHSADTLTPLTLHRIHPVEAVLFELRGIVVTGVVAGVGWWLWRGEAVAYAVLGVDALGFGLNAALGNLRHSGVWLRFGARWERWLLSPAQHQLHHSADPAEAGCNFGVWFGLWDRLAGTWRAAPESPPLRFGLRRANHGQDAWSATFGPFAAVFRLHAPKLAAALGLALPAAAAADEAGGTILVVEDGAVPAVGGAAQIVDEETLERQENDDIHQVLNKVPGVYVRGEDGFGLRPNIGLRGANSDRSAKVTLLEDGVPLSPAPYAAPAAYYFPLTTRLVGVEVFKGPSAIAHGPQTIGGAVNLRTRGVPEQQDGALDAAYGAYDTVKVHGWAGDSAGPWGLMVEGAHLSSGGFKELDSGGPTGFSRQDALLKLRFAPSATDALELKLGVGRERSNETYLGLSAADYALDPYRRYAASQLDVMSWQATRTALSWTHTGDFTLHTVAYFNALDRSWTKLNGFTGGPDLHALLNSPDSGQAATYLAILRGDEDSASDDQLLALGTNARSFQNGGAQTVLRLYQGAGAVDNVVELGLRLHADRAVRVHTEEAYRMAGGAMVSNGLPEETTLDSLGTALALAPYLRDQLHVGRLELVPGVRVEAIRAAEGTRESGPGAPVMRVIALPGLSAAFEPAPNLLTFAGVHRGFSPVAPGEDAAVLPETAWNAELGARFFPGAVYAELSGFGSWYQNLQGQCTLSAGCAEEDVDRQYNGGEVLVGGVEAAFSAEKSLGGPALPGHPTLIDRSARARLSYTLTASSYRTSFASEFPQWGAVQAGDRLPYVPVHQGAGEVALFGPRGSLGLTAAARGEMRDVAGQGPIPEDERIPASFQLDANAELHLTESLSAYALARNLTNAQNAESLRPFGARPQAPRVVMVGVKVRGL